MITNRSCKEVYNMSFELIKLSSEIAEKQAVSSILDCNRYSERYGLQLSEKAAVALNKTRMKALNANGRIEFGGGAIDKLIYAFCDSPYMEEQNYESNLHDLIEAFYYYKNETLDMISDDDLIEIMRVAFNGDCRGSVEMLVETALEKIARNIRNGRAPDYNEELCDSTGEQDNDD